MLLTSILAVALIGVTALILARLMLARFKNLPAIISAFTSAVVFVLGTVLLKTVLGTSPIRVSIPLSGPFKPNFYADTLSATMLVLAALLWFVVSIYAPKYMRYEGKSTLFYFSTVTTFFAVLGVFLAGDLFTMLLFFELMTVASSFWVIHKWNKQAIKAGYFYLFFSIIGGLFIALGIVVMGSGTAVLPAIGSGSVIPTSPTMFNWSILLFIVGFGIKAGMVPLHLWLPRAHAVSPTPGSALLSGMLIKVGAYGLIRIIGFAGWGTVATQNKLAWVGTFLAAFGTLTMLVGVIAALLQSDGKRLLAYHSVSQMGYIIMGLGLAFFLGKAGELCFVGSVYHMINHALFKTALFLGFGIIYLYTKETNLYKLGGLWKRYPVLAVLMLLAVLGIAGAPGLNGYVSKTLLHHGVNVAVESAVPYAGLLEKLFTIVGVGTAASFAKFYYLIFIRKPDALKAAETTALHTAASAERLDAATKTERLEATARNATACSAVDSPQKPLNKGLFAMYGAIGLLAAVMLVIGTRPNLFLNNIAVPIANTVGMLNISATGLQVSFWNSKDIFGIVVTLALGVLVCWGGLKSGAFHWSAPSWLTLEGLGKFAYTGLAWIWEKAIKIYNTVLADITGRGKVLKTQFSSSLYRFDRQRSFSIEKRTYAGISGDVAIVGFVLMLFIAGYTLINLTTWF